MTRVNEKIEWAKNQVERMKMNLKMGGFVAIEAKVKLKRINELTEEEFQEYAIASYDYTHDLNT